MSMNAFYQKSSLKCLGSILRLYTDKIFFSTKHTLMVLCRRSLCSTTARRTPRGYAAEGGTTVNVMNNDEELGLMIDGYSQVFRNFLNKLKTDNMFIAGWL